MIQERDDISEIIAVSILCHFGVRSNCAETIIEKFHDHGGLGILATLWQSWLMPLRHFRNKHAEYIHFLMSFLELLNALENEDRKNVRHIDNCNWIKSAKNIPALDTKGSFPKDQL